MFGGLPGGSSGGEPASFGGCLFVIVVTGLVFGGFTWLLFVACP